MISLLRFYLASGARVALTAAVPLAGIAVVGVGLQQYPVSVLEGIAALIAGPSPSFFAILVLSALALALALWAAPRVALGSHGWIRHLPISRAQHRLALILATACAEGALVVAALGGAVLASWKSGAIAWSGFLVPPVVAIATATIAVGVRPSHRRDVRLRPPPFPDVIEVRIALRAMGARAIGAWLAGVVPLGATFLFLRNNVLPSPLAGGAARFGGALAVTLALAQLANVLEIRRPSWPWARSLPSSARTRVTGDAVLLGLLCLPIVIVTAFLNLGAAGVVLALTPFLALRAAAAMRRSDDFRLGASGPVLIEGAIASGLVALLPWLGCAALAAIHFALRDATERERALKVTRWSGLHHVAAGDTLSWTR
jgi:hypothetical protein